MLKQKPKAIRMSKNAAPDATGWEVRPGGLLVQRRSSDSNINSNPIPSISVRVKYGSLYHDFNISTQASFGDLKKMLAGPTGLHPQDQKLIYKDKERDSKSFLDVAGLKNGSKIVLIEDALNKERRCLQSRRNANAEKALKEIAEIRLEVDKLAEQVESLDAQINGGGKKVVENVLLNLIESLMAQLIKLDAIVADGDVKLQRRVQVKRVQRYIETLDMLKIRNGLLENNEVKVPLLQQNRMSIGEMPIPNQKQDEQKSLGPAVTTKWETFDSTPESTIEYSNNHKANGKLNWEFFE